MMLCWRHNPKHRPHFSQIVKDIAPELCDKFRELSYVFSDDYAALMQSRPPVAEPDEPVHNVEDGEEDIYTPLTRSREHIEWERALSHASIQADKQLDTCSHAEADHCQCQPLKRRGRTSISGANGEPARPGEPSTSNYAGMRRSQPSTHSSLSGRSLQPVSYSSDGSKDSSKSSGSSHNHLNGMANGHIPKSYLPRYTEC